MKTLLAAFLILSTPNLVFAASCPKPVVLLQEGSPAPCTGYLFSPETELEARIAIQTQDKKDEIIKIQGDMLKIRTEQVNNYETMLKNRESESFWQRTVYFGLGVLVTGFIAANVGR